MPTAVLLLVGTSRVGADFEHVDDLDFDLRWAFVAAGLRECARERTEQEQCRKDARKRCYCEFRYS